MWNPTVSAWRLIPHTLKVTTLGPLQVGDPVNLETDVLAKYVEQQLRGGDLGSTGRSRNGVVPTAAPDSRHFKDAWQL